jgi:hyperosmotically inducible protein
MKKATLFLTVAAVGMTAIGCSTAANTNTTTVGRTNANTATMNSSNTAVVVNTNNMETGSMNSNSAVNANVSRADYDRDRAKYEANKGASTIGQGANDSWIWFKTKSALATTNDLRDSTINVDVANDVITLKGTVATAAQKAQAETVAKGIEGQKGVKNELKVQASDSMTNQMTSSNAATHNTNANHK